MPNLFLAQFPLNMPASEVLDRIQPGLEAMHFFGDAYPKWWVNFGPGIMAGFLGGGVEYAPGTTWYHEIGVESLADLHLAYDPDNVWWRRVQDITREAVQRWGQTVAIGLTDIGGNLDILASLRGTHRLLFDLYDAPGEVERLTRAITPLWLRYYDELCALIAPAARGITCWAPPWNPGRGYMLQSDFSYMISPEMFDRYVLPDLEACCAAMDYAFYHMDGKGQIPHLDKLLAIPNLRGIQWQPGDGAPKADQWPDLLRRIREAGKLCQVYVTREGALRILRELGGRGFLIVIIEDDLTPAEAQAFMDALPAAAHA
jgi:5-methyltetrahydrofolate--homocysteine methyltransferase